jgi:glucokinase
MILAGDIGGTKTAIGIYSGEAGPSAPIVEGTFRSADYPSLESIAKQFLAKTGLRVDSACFGVAGPLIDGRVKTTNLPWIVDEVAIARALRIDSVHLLNDLEAIAYAVPELRSQDLETLSSGRPVERANIGVIAPGTGLGEAFLTWEDGQYRAHSSEGGHSDFAPVDDLQIRLLKFMRERFDHVSYERVCSGVGIPHVYDFFAAEELIPETVEASARIAAAGDRTLEIIKAAFDPTTPSPRCIAAIDTVVSIMGSETGNLALKIMAAGGIYVTGGIPLHIIPALRGSRFLQSFRRKGRLSELMDRIPVYLIVSRVGLTGAAAFGLKAKDGSADLVSHSG